MVPFCFSPYVCLLCPSYSRFLGTPFFHSMVARSRASSSNISVLVDPEIILLPDFLSTLHYAHKLDHEWLLVAMAPNVSYFPFDLDETGQHWLRGDGKRIKKRKVWRYLSQVKVDMNCMTVKFLDDDHRWVH